MQGVGPLRTAWRTTSNLSIAGPCGDHNLKYTHPPPTHSSTTTQQQKQQQTRPTHQVGQVLLAELVDAPRGLRSHGVHQPAVVAPWRSKW